VARERRGGEDDTGTRNRSAGRVRLTRADKRHGDRASTARGHVRGRPSPIAGGDASPARADRVRPLACPVRRRRGAGGAGPASLTRKRPGRAPPRARRLAALLLRRCRTGCPRSRAPSGGGAGSGGAGAAALTREAHWSRASAGAASCGAASAAVADRVRPLACAAGFRRTETPGRGAGFRLSAAGAREGARSGRGRLRTACSRAHPLRRTQGEAVRAAVTASVGDRSNPLPRSRGRGLPSNRAGC
jgi:hypothetical protein